MAMLKTAVQRTLIAIAPWCLVAGGIATLQVTSPLPAIAQGAQTESQASEALREAGDRHFQQGLTQFQAEQYRNALALWLEALAFYEHPELQATLPVASRRGAALTHHNIAAAASRLGLIAEGITHSRAALALFRDLDDPYGQAKALNALGAAYLSIGRPEDALTYYQQALAVSNDLEDTSLRLKILYNLGGAYFEVEQFAQGTEYFEATLALAQSTHDQIGVAIALNGIGHGYLRQGDYDTALTNFQQSLVLSRELHLRHWEGVMLNNLGWLYFRWGQYDTSLTYYQDSLAVMQSLQSREDIGLTLANLGDLWTQQHQPELAIVFFKQAINIYEKIRAENQTLAIDLQQSYTNTVAKHYRTLANLLLQQDRVIEAQRVLDLLKVEELDGYLRGVPSSNSANEISGFPGAGALWVQADWTTEDRHGEADRLFDEGRNYYIDSQLQQAAVVWEEALAIYRELGDTHQVNNVLKNLVTAYFFLGQYQLVFDYAEEILVISRTLDDRQGEAQALGMIGVSHLVWGQYSQAITFFEQALAIAREIDNDWLEAQFLSNLGSAYHHSGQFHQAFDYYQQALTISQERGWPDAEAAHIGNLGSVYYYLGNYQQAIDHLERGIVLSREAGNYRRVGSYLASLGSIRNTLGQYQQAIAYLQESLVIARQVGYRGQEANCLMGLGEAYTGLGEYDRALDYYEQAIALFQALSIPKMEALARQGLGQVWYELGEYDQAIDQYQQALAIDQRIADLEGEAYALVNMGETQTTLENYPQALQTYQQALLIFNESGIVSGQSRTLGNIGNILATQGQPELAIAFLKAAVESREFIRSNLQGLPVEIQQSYTEKIADDYRLLADLLLQQDRIVEAQRVLDLLKVQELDGYLRGVRGNDNTAAGVDYLQPEAAILARYDEIQQSAIAAGQELDRLKAIPQDQRTAAQTDRIAQLTELLDAINRDFRNFARSPEIRTLIAQLSYEAQEASLSLNQLDRLRDELQQLNAAIFYPLILEDRLELVITTPNAPPLRRTVPISRAELNAAILAFRTALTNPVSNAEVPAQTLYTWLIQPLEADLAEAGVETIIYAPDGQLRYIPLAALHDGDRWLIERYQVNNITAESLTDLTETDTGTPLILAAAYADESLIHTPEVNGKTYQFRGLPGAGREIQALPTDTKFWDEAFSLSALRPIMDEYTVLHFATHAAFVPGVPEDSFILFGNGDTPTLRDVANWSLNGVELVVLSACETGVGGLGSGEEVLGLGYQFQISGAKAVLASLWQVSDFGTQALMAAFYDGLLQGMTKAEALQSAQLALINESSVVANGDRRSIAVLSNHDEINPAHALSYSHPYYWAPFILIGNGL
jgi:CHAT domain-containing protein/tetratricopeptide (TPR) repeat protein